MCVDHSPPAGRPAVRHNAGPVPQVVLEPVDAVEITALMDNVTDIFMPDQGPVPAHCTGWRAQHAMAHRFGEAFIPNTVGSRFRL
jgi:7,8-dihydropterin-6-yl-methyl-4-(beta-D-ribofuranosyl)aminobenzene 5'-phosphate synthase